MSKKIDEKTTWTMFSSDNQKQNIVLYAQLLKPRTNVSNFSFKVLYDQEYLLFLNDE